MMTGMPGLAGLFIPLLLASSYSFLIYAGALWSLAFTSGVLFKTFPTHALLALYCIAFLCVMPSRGDRDGILRESVWGCGFGCDRAGIVCAIAVGATLGRCQRVRLFPALDAAVTSPAGIFGGRLRPTR